MKQIFLKVLKDGTTTSNVSSLIFDGENLTTKVSIDYSNVDFSDWIKQADIFVGQTRETDYVYTNEVGNILEFTLEEGHLVKGYLRIQPLVKRLEKGSIYSKQKWETIELKVKKSLNVLEDNISITQSIAEQWEIRIKSVEDAEVIRQLNEGTRITNENTRIANENARNVFVEYNGSTAYVVGNKVSYNGSSYVCILDSLGNLPTNPTYWLLIASKGDNTTASSVTNTPSGNISSTTVQGAINELDTEKADKLFATNLVTNGDFSNGASGWTSSASTLIASNNTLIATGDGTLSTFNAWENRTSTTLGVGIKEYARVRIRVRDNQSQFIRLRQYAGTNDVIVNLPIQDQWYSISGIVTGTSTTASTPFIRFQASSTYIDTSTANGKVFEIERPLIIDLTATFGAGNEPTKEQMDKLLSVYPNSWFNGTSEIGSIGALMRATLGVQVVTPTLLNSRTGTAQYVVSNDGLVIFRGTASGGSLNTNIFVLPENIRPIATRVFPISANSAFGVITVAANGEVRQTVGALTNVFLDGIAFKVGV